jgi:hypothetical protein
MRLAALFLAAILLMQAADPLAARARAKLTQIKEDKAKKGSVIVFTSQELNSWIREELAEEPALGMRDTKLELSDGIVSFEAIADFGKLAGGNPLVNGLIGGERPLKIVAQPDTAAGKVTVHLKQVEISGVPLSGILLNFAAKLVISLFYDDVEIDQPFEMGHNIDHATIDAAALRVYIKR